MSDKSFLSKAGIKAFFFRLKVFSLIFVFSLFNISPAFSFTLPSGVYRKIKLTPSVNGKL